MRYSNIWYVIIPLILILILVLPLIWYILIKNKKGVLITSLFIALLGAFDIASTINYSKEYTETYQIYSLSNEKDDVFVYSESIDNGQIFANVKIKKGTNYIYKDICLGQYMHYTYADDVIPSIKIVYESWCDNPISYITLPKTNLEVIYKDL